MEGQPVDMNKANADAQVCIPLFLRWKHGSDIAS